jgi:hypothetical protein
MARDHDDRIGLEDLLAARFNRGRGACAERLHADSRLVEATDHLADFRTVALEVGKRRREEDVEDRLRHRRRRF